MPAQHRTVVLFQLLRNVMVVHAALLFIDNMLRAHSNKALSLLRRKVQSLFIREVLNLLLILIALRWHLNNFR